MLILRYFDTVRLRSGLAVSPPLCTRWSSAWATCLRMFDIEYGVNHLFGELWKGFTNLCGCIEYFWALLSKPGFFCQVVKSAHLTIVKSAKINKQRGKTKNE